MGETYLVGRRWANAGAADVPRLVRDVCVMEAALRKIVDECLCGATGRIGSARCARCATARWALAEVGAVSAGAEAEGR
jgi:hypothetical protein